LRVTKESAPASSWNPPTSTEASLPPRCALSSKTATSMEMIKQACDRIEKACAELR
jgi:hypothetical protein